MTFLDTGILVGAVLEMHPEHNACREALERFEGLFTDDHCLAECFATLTGFYKVPNHVAAELIWGLLEVVASEPLAHSDYQAAIREAKNRGIMGGGIYDSLHATYARRKGARRIITRNPSHFAHAAPEMEILTPN